MNRNFYLVQRLETQKSADVSKCRFGQRFELDYMGSAEFEFGAFPKFLRSINASEIVSFSHKLDGVEIFGVYDPAKQTLEHVIKSIEDIAANRLRLKESAYFPNKTTYAERVDAWVDIEQNVFWSLKDYRTTFKSMVARSVEYMDNKKLTANQQ